MSENKAVFTLFEGKKVLMHIKDGRAEHIYVYEDGNYDIGTVINCLAENHVDNIDATFVRYAPQTSGFINRNIKGQQIVPLQYKKHPHDGKCAMFTDRITIGGEYIVITDDASYVKASSKIPSAEKDKIIDEFTDDARSNNIGIIIRTKAYTEDNGLNKAKKELLDIKEMLTQIKEKSIHTSEYTILYRPLPEYISDILYLISEGIEEIVTDIKELYEDLGSDHESVSGPVNITDRVSLRFYTDKLINLCNLYGFNAKISEALSRTVHLKSGAYITFDVTEALTAIDVNSAASSRNTEREETFLGINIEAADEIARQLVLRNLSGMIVIDFINMKNPESYREIEEHIKTVIRHDRAGCRFIDFSGLNLCELIRTRTGNPLTLYFKKNR